MLDPPVFDIVVVDNAFNDGSRDVLSAAAEAGLIALANDRNEGLVPH